jgi:large subunit ribosomal protein L21
MPGSACEVESAAAQWASGAGGMPDGSTGVGFVYAIVSDGSHQYKVEEGLIFEVQLKDLPEDAKTLEFDRVLMVGDVEGGPRVGTPTVSGAKVSATVVRELKGDKLFTQKFRRRKGSSVKTGHRQRYLQVKVEKITY